MASVEGGNDTGSLKIETGFIRMTNSTVLALKFEGFSNWLIPLDSMNCTELWLLDFSSASGMIEELERRGFDTTLVKRGLDAIGFSRLRFPTASLPVPESAIFLISGTLPFLRLFGNIHPLRRGYFLLDASFRGKGITTRDGIHWKRVPHTLFGGSTTFVCLIGYRGLAFNPTTTSLTRTIGHFLEYGIKPTGGLKTDDDYSTNDLLDLNRLSAHVHFATHYERSGWGRRCLTPEEIGIALGLPARLRSGGLSMAALRIVPVQILEGILDSVLKTSDRVLEPLETPLHGDPCPLATETWLPDIGKFLSHAWVDKDTVTAKAVKTDDAKVPSHIWDQRTTLPLPQFGPFIPFFRDNRLRRLKTQLLSEFYGFMTEHHGTDWLAELLIIRRRLSSVQALFLAERRGLGKRQRKGGLLNRFKESRAGNLVIPRTLGLSQVARELFLDAQAGTEAVGKVADSSWWGWDNGSALIHWRWPKGQQRDAARDGMPAYLLSTPPVYSPRNRPTKPEVFELLLPKLQKVIDRGYVISNQDPRAMLSTYNFIQSCIDFFYVPKGKDVRVVYNGTSSGLNACVWVPNFWLPTPKTASRTLNYNYCGVDVDLGDYFLNFPLPEVFRKFSGIDLSEFRDHLGYGHLTNAQFQTRWERCWMGFRPSPYYAVRFYYWAEEFARGNPRCPKNAMRWDRVLTNLPGDPKWDPSLPTVMKWCDIINNIAADVAAFIDDLRFSGLSEERVWAATRKFVARLQWLGIQDAPRKRRAPIRKTGAWAGCMFCTLDSKITQTVSEEKWCKGKNYIDELIAEFGDIDSPLPLFDYKMLERIRGFLCHLSMTFENITPFLKGFHMTLCRHLPHRNSEGWKLSERVWAAYVYDKEESGDITSEEAAKIISPPHFRDIPIPAKAQAVPRFEKDLEALARIFESDLPPNMILRTLRVFQILYGFVDASGKGFGATVLTLLGILYRIGLWNKDAETNSSNWKELANLVHTLEELGKSGELQGAVIYFFTDNSTAERAIYKGNSTSSKLFDLVVRMRVLEMRYECKIVISHVAGERMKNQGTDGVSRGHLKEGVAAGDTMLSHVPLNEDPLDRSPSLRNWIISWVGDDVEFLKPGDWFERGHDHRGGSTDSRGYWWPHIVTGTFVWSPPPAAADVALEELRKARIKRQDSTHIFICPKLVTTQWQKQLYKAADIVFELPPGPEYWNGRLLGNYGEHRRCTQWSGSCGRCLKKRTWLQGVFCANFYWSVGGFPPCHSMWCGECYTSSQGIKFPVGAHAREPGKNEDDPLDVERVESLWGRKAQRKDDYLHARDGDHLMVPFECHRCVFRKLRKMDPDRSNPQDCLLEACIIQVNIDAFWSRASATVAGNRDRLRLGVDLSNQMGLKGPYIQDGPLPDYDHCGYEVAVQMVLYSRRKGAHGRQNIQFDTARKLRSCYSNQVRASSQSNRVTTSMGDSKGKYQRLSSDPCASLWFHHFFIGCQIRMGQDWRPNQAMSIKLILATLIEVEDRIENAPSPREYNRWVTFHSFFVVTYVLSLRGPEGFLLDVGELRRHWGRTQDDHVIIALKGKIKGEQHHRVHMIPCVRITKSGISVENSIDRLLKHKDRLGLVTGPAISDDRGFLYSTRAINDCLHEVLEDLFESKRDFFPPHIVSLEMLRERYQVFRTLRRSSDTRATEETVSPKDIDIVNRWEAVGNASGKKPTGPMRIYYADITLLLKPFLRYTGAM